MEQRFVVNDLTGRGGGLDNGMMVRVLHIRQEDIVVDPGLFYQRREAASMNTWKFIKVSLRDLTEDHKILYIKKHLNYPIWQLSGILGITFITSLFFIWKIV